MSKILQRCQVRFIFLEQNPTHAQNLQAEVDKLGALPSSITRQIVNEDFEVVLREALDNLEQVGRPMAPSFFFFDPYGFHLPMDLIQRILGHPRSEILITFMVRYIDMAIRNPSQEANMDSLFGDGNWRALRNIRDTDERHGEMIRLYTERLGCSHSSVLEMRGEHREHKYSLIHATNHRRGRELMKSAMWKMTPEGSFAIYQSHDPRQLTLITLAPDLNPLESDLLGAFAGQEVRYQQVTDWLVDQRWDVPHLHEVIRKLRAAGQIEASGYTGRFAFEKNPLLRFRKRQDGQ